MKLKRVVSLTILFSILSPGETRADKFLQLALSGLRLAWNLSTIVNLDAARSSESTMFYMEAGHQF